MSDNTRWMRPGPGHVVPSVELRTDRPHPARVYDYLLGGKTNFDADRQAAEAALELNPTGAAGPVENRRFMTRAVRYLATETGIRQFLDIGTGIPTPPNVHETAQTIDPAARVVYVDNDPIVLAHARALMTSTPQGRTLYLNGDLREPHHILNNPDLQQTLDFDKPIGLLLIATLHLVRDIDDARRYCKTFIQAMPAGSFLALSHLTTDLAPERMLAVSESMRQRGMTLVPRPKAAIKEFLTGLEILDPGLVSVHRWRPDPGNPPREDPDYDAAVSFYGAIARIPAK